jgi:protocatechuate 3,4-dioxygenase, beta subunit
MKTPIALTLLSLTIACAQPNKQDRPVGTRCEDCDMMFDGMPTQLNSSTSIAPANEPGEKMIITGTIYKRDGKTPATDVILYMYHTDAKGEYSPAPNQKQAVRHGHLRGWVKTDASGKYSITTIRPASYPNGRAPQHIHPMIKEPGVSLYWIDEYLFDDDPFLTDEEKKHQEKRGGSGIIHLTKNVQGVWVGKRDIILGLNIPNY